MLETNRTSYFFADRDLAHAESVWAIGYVCLIILLITQNPFDYRWNGLIDWTTDSYFSLVDAAQNILLFFPLGLVLALNKKTSAGLSLLIIVLFALLIEVLQFYTERHSSYFDVMTNALGGVFGVSFASVFDRKELRSLNFGIMLIPFLWVTAMRSVVEPIVLLYVPALLVLFISSYLDSPSIRTKKIWASLFLVLMAIMPVAYIQPLYAIIVMLVLIVLYAFFRHKEAGQNLLLIAFGVSLLLVISANVYGWLHAGNIGWNVPTHLRWIECLGLLGLFHYTRLGEIDLNAGAPR